MPVHDLPRAGLSAKDQRGAQGACDGVVAAGDAALMLLELQHVAEIDGGEPRYLLEGTWDLFEVERAPFGEVGRRSPSRVSDVGGPTAWRFHGIGECDVVSVREEADDWFRVTHDVDTKCVAECLDNLSQVVALGRPTVGMTVDRPPPPALAAVNMRRSELGPLQGTTLWSWCRARQPRCKRSPPPRRRPASPN